MADVNQTFNPVFVSHLLDNNNIIILQILRSSSYSVAYFNIASS